MKTAPSFVYVAAPYTKVLEQSQAATRPGPHLGQKVPCLPPDYNVNGRSLKFDEYLSYIESKRAALANIWGNAFAPIVEFDRLAELYRIDKLDGEFWYRVCEPFLEISTSLVVVMAPGWEESKGVQAEIEYFREQNKPITYIPYKDM